MSPYHEPSIEAIKRRSKGRSELSGRTDRPLHCTHMNHEKGEKYESIEGSVRATVVEHLVFHELFVGEEWRIGLKPCTNSYAIRMLRRESEGFMKKIGKSHLLLQETVDATEMWKEVIPIFIEMGIIK